MLPEKECADVRISCLCNIRFGGLGDIPFNLVAFKKVVFLKKYLFYFLLPGIKECLYQSFSGSRTALRLFVDNYFSSQEGKRKQRTFDYLPPKRTYVCAMSKVPNMMDYLLFLHFFIT